MHRFEEAEARRTVSGLSEIGAGVNEDMKKCVIFAVCILLAAAAVFAASYPNRGRSENVVVTLGPSSKFSEKELNDAVRCVKRKFWEYSNCELTELWYNEAHSDLVAESYARERHISLENIIVLDSNYKENVKKKDGSIEVRDYPAWNWIMVKNGIWKHWKIVQKGRI